jgi:phospholipid-binding lipoprotein MlaA
VRILSIILTAFILFLLPALSFAEDLQPEKAVENGVSDEYAAEDDEFDDYLKYEEDEDFEEINDPIEPWNRLVFKFNDKFYELLFKPAAKTYNAVVPEKGRISVRNFFYNLAMPVRFVNDILQFKIKEAGVELARFGVNSTLGIVGLFDVAEKQLDLKKHDEDLGQTLGFLGLGDGFYIVWPFLGPSSLRDTAGLAGDTFLTPINHVSDDEAVYALNAYKYLNNGSLRIEDYDDLKESAIDPYTAFKDAYFQYRREQIKK